jgi:hypothetical protein
MTPHPQRVSEVAERAAELGSHRSAASSMPLQTLRRAEGTLRPADAGFRDTQGAWHSVALDLVTVLVQEPGSIKPRATHCERRSLSLRLGGRSASHGGCRARAGTPPPPPAAGVWVVPRVDVEGPPAGAAALACHRAVPAASGRGPCMACNMRTVWHSLSDSGPAGRQAATPGLQLPH